MTLEPDLGRRLVAHLRAGTTDMAEAELLIPVRHYFDEDHAARERALFSSYPLVVAHSSSIPSPGDFMTVEVIGVPLLLVRQGDGSVRGFRNVCRHRGGRVEQETGGSRRIFTYRYHGWSYDRMGALHSVPYEEGFDRLDRRCYGLVPVATGERHGFIWAQLDSTGGELDVASYLGTDLDGQLASFRLDAWRVHRDETFTLSMNWKLVVDGIIDVYHPKFLHPHTVGRLIHTNVHAWDCYGLHGRLAMARRTLGSAADYLSDDADLRPYVIALFFVFPNTMFTVEPGHFEHWTILPDATTATGSRASLRLLVPNPPDTERERAPLDKSWELLRTAVLCEDWPMAESIQRGAPVAGINDFVLGRNETALQHLHCRLMERLEEETDE